MKILVVDDSNVITLLWNLILEKQGYKVTQLNSPSTALYMLTISYYDGMIIDYHMDEMDGLELARQVRQLKNYRYTPIIMITADGNEEVRENAKQAGINAWMTKPVHPTSLLEVIGRLCPFPETNTPD